MLFIVKSAFLTIFFATVIVSGRIHKLPLTDDERHYVDLTTFGFFQGGVLDVHMVNFMLPTGPVMGEYGFTLDRTANDAINPYLEAHTDICFLKESDNSIVSPQHPAIVFLKLDFVNLRLNISCKGEVTALHLYQNRTVIPTDRIKRQSQYLFINRRRRAPIGFGKIEQNYVTQCSNAVLPITKETHNGFDYYNTSFAMYVASDKEEGLYNLYFHNCPGKRNDPAVNVMLEIYESNDGNFLSAGEMPLPALYSMMSIIFFLSAGFWTFILKKSRHPVFRIHIIMCVLVYLKALSLAFHGINYHFIQTRGEHVTTWAILYYITHLLKGAVLFVTIVLVGTGCNFIKHILADRDKKLFMIVIPLQVVANVAEIIIAESEEGSAEHNAWRDLFIFVDLLCCGAILFPVVWSIRHLEDASSTDGKAAINLRKLKLFRHFYIMVVCYIYFTRIIVSVLKNLVPFQYSWIDEMFREMATFVFFVMTGYKFRPAAANPYFTPNHIEDVEPQVNCDSVKDLKCHMGNVLSLLLYGRTTTPREMSSGFGPASWCSWQKANANYDLDDYSRLSDIGVLEGVSRVSNREKRREDMQPLMQETNYNSD